MGGIIPEWWAASSGIRNRRLGEARRTRDRLIDDIVEGRLDSATFGPKATELDQKCKQLEAALRAVPPQPIALHPAVLADYERKLERLQAAIEQGTSEGNTEYGHAIRDLVECVTVRHDDSQRDKVRIEVTGRLNELLGEAAFPNRVGRLGGSGGPLPSIPPTGFAIVHPAAESCMKRVLRGSWVDTNHRPPDPQSVSSH